MEHRMTVEGDRNVQVFVTSYGEPSAAEVTDRIQELLAVAKGEATAVFREAVSNDDEWRNAFSNPAAYLEARGVVLPERVQVSLKERPTLTPPLSSFVSRTDLEPRPLDYERLRAYCQSLGGQLIWQQSCEEVCRRSITYTRCYEQPDGTWICFTIEVCQERGFDCSYGWVCSSP
jgi:hypothetical protein